MGRRVKIPHTSSPTVSVVVLAWQLDRSLVECLQSLTESVDAPPFEVVIVVNGARDAVRKTVSDDIVGARIVDLAYNVGYGGGCNAGVSVARGSYVLFVNDDATADPHALHEMVTALEHDSTIGAVAGVLMNSNGTVQEAGRRVLPSGHTLPFAEGLTLSEAAAQGFLDDRSIDYGSGAALMIRRDVFNILGGFDARYEPAYCEDVDLCFRVRALGHDVRLAPAARFTHARGRSTENNRRFQEFAIQHADRVFRGLWADVLENAPDEDASIDVVCPIPLSRERAVVARPQSRPVVERALHIAHNYSVRLGELLDERERRIAHLQRDHDELVGRHENDVANMSARIAELDRERAEARELFDRAESERNDVAKERDALGAHAHELDARLRDLENRGPLGLMRWKVGAIKNKAKQKREQ